MSRTKNAFRNTGWGLFQKVVTLLMPFITRTAIIKVLGVDYLGLSSLFGSILSLLSLAELGISGAIISSMYKPIAENDTDLICALMQFYKKSYRIIGVVVTIVGLLLLPFLPYMIKGGTPSDINVYTLYIIYLLNNALSYFLFAYKNCLFIAHQRNDINCKIQTVVLFAQSVLQLVLIILFKNYYCYAVVIPICSVLINLTTAHFANKYYPNYTCRGELPLKEKNNLKQKVIGLLTANISSTIRSSIDSLFLSMFMGLSVVAMYSNYFYIATAVAGFIQVLNNSLVAGVGNSLVTESVEKNYNDFLKFTFLLQWIIGWCAICILCLEQPFMKIWVGEDYMLKDTMVLLCSIYFFVNCIGLIRNVYTQALGMWWQLRFLSVADIFANTFLNYFLGKEYGPYGILTATIVDIVFVSIPWTTYFLFKDFFGIKKYCGYIMLYIKYFLIMILTGGITLFICKHISMHSSLLQLVVNGVICILIPNLIYLVIYRNNEYSKKVLKSVRAYLKGGFTQ